MRGTDFTLKDQPPLDQLDNKYVYVDPELLEVYDGDTIRIRIDVGWDLDLKMWIRLQGYNAAEIKGPEKKQGVSARMALEDILTGRKRLIVQSFINKEKDRIKSFERFICQAWVLKNDGWHNVSSLMLAQGWHVERS